MMKATIVLLYPGAEEIFDFDRGIELLDDKMRLLFPEYHHLAKPKFADTLVKLYTRKGEEKWILIFVDNSEEGQHNSLAGRMAAYGPRILEYSGQSVISLILPADKKDLVYQRAEYLHKRYLYDFEYDIHEFRKWKTRLDYIKWKKKSKERWNKIMSEAVLFHLQQGGE
jgi:hypothetical protein